MRYRALVVEQIDGGPEIAMFAAPAFDIARWAGIPQRRRFEGGVETAGFQREGKPARIRELARFMNEPANVIQNPLLAAVQKAESIRLVDRQADGSCFVEIGAEDYSKTTLLELLELVKEGLIARLPALAARQPDLDALSNLRQQLAHVFVVQGEPHDSDEQIEDDVTAEGVAEDDVQGIATGLFQEETQVIDFFDELNTRASLLRELGDRAAGLNDIAGFDRDYLLSLVQPIVLVDGQHRLLGAMQATHERESSVEGMERVADLVDSGLSAEDARVQFALETGRLLPISLLMSNDPAEHVFQFIVVNQKATPMSNALLGTIVATSLTQEELEPIAQRLSNAGIQLESSRAVAYLSRSPDSPFRGLVSTGVKGDQPNALPWSVLLKLANIVRNLKGGESYHPPKVDYTRQWRTDFIAKTGLIPSDIEGDDARLEYWSAIDGPWRRLFLELHTRIRDQFGSDDSGSENYWGSTTSNLYNMVSLHILTVDFFKYLLDKDRELSDWDDVSNALGAWIGPLNSGYFNRDFRMKGTKKDQPRIKAAWSEAWAEFRTTRRLPRVERYNPGGQQNRD
jgi:hypothetical protein